MFDQRLGGALCAKLSSIAISTLRHLVGAALLE
jgi:hypothetical protein